MILQAWLTLPSCLASSNRPTLLRITFWSLVIVGSSPAVARRGDIAPPRRPAAHRFHLIRQIKSRLLHTDLGRIAIAIVSQRAVKLVEARDTAPPSAQISPRRPQL